jgi:hypothetical protein
LIPYRVDVVVAGQLSDINRERWKNVPFLKKNDV